MEKAVNAEIVIVGGGICGLATALALHRKGIRSLVLERSETVRATGAAIIMQGNGWRTLDQLGIGSTLRQTAMQIQRGRSILVGEGESKETSFGIDHEFRIVRRSDLIKSLADSLPEGTVRTNCQVLSIELDPLTQYPQVMLSNGTTIQTKIVIGCDGVYSVIATMFGLHQTKLLCFSTRSLRGFTNYPQGHPFPSEFVIMTRGQVQLGRIPVTDKLVYWFVTRPGTSQDRAISKDPVLIRELLIESMKGFPVEINEMMRHCELSSLHLAELKYRPPWGLIFNKFRKGTVTIAGDAMHATGPFIAQGGAASIEDGLVLARCLAQKMQNSNNVKRDRNNIEEAFDQYVKERRMRLLWISLHTFLAGQRLDTKSIILKFIILKIINFLFRDPEWHARYDCGTL